MKTLLIATIAFLPGFGPAPDASFQDTERGQTTGFTWVDVHVDSGSQPLAAWQLEFKAAPGFIRIVGIEGGEHAAFKEPPFYDPRARMRGERVVIAAFNTGDELPTGRTRVARIHVQLLKEGTPGFEARLEVAATKTGKHIEAVASWEIGR